MWLPYPALAAIEYDAVLHCGLDAMDIMTVMFLWGIAIDTDVIVVGNDTWEMVSDLVHVNLEVVVAHLHAEGHVHKPVPPFCGC